MQHNIHDIKKTPARYFPFTECSFMKKKLNDYHAGFVQ